MKLRNRETLQYSFDRVLLCAAVFALTGTLIPPAFAVSTWQSLLQEGDKQLSLQELASAEQRYRTALKEIEQTPRTQDDLVLCLEKLASVLTLENKGEEPVALYKRSLHILESEYGKNSPKIVPTLFALGSFYEAEGDPKVAMSLYSRALAINETNYGPSSPAVAISLHNLGRASFSAGQAEQAEHHYKRSLAILMQEPGLEASQQLESLLRDYHDLLRKKDTSDKDLVSEFQSEFLKEKVGTERPATGGVPMSVWQQQMAVQQNHHTATQTNEEQHIIKRAFPEPMNNAAMAPAYKLIGEVYKQQHVYGQEEERYQKMIAIDVRALGPDHPAVADDLYGLVMLYISQCRYAEAKPLLVHALSIYKAVYGCDSLLVKTVESTLASVAVELGKPAEAAAMYNNILEHSAAGLGPNDLETARVLNELGFLYYREGKLQDARTVYQWALSSTEAAAGKDSPLLGACLADYAKVLADLGQSSEANLAHSRAVAILAKTHK